MNAQNGLISGTRPYCLKGSFENIFKAFTGGNTTNDVPCEVIKGSELATRDSILLFTSLLVFFYTNHTLRRKIRPTALIYPTYYSPRRINFWCSWLLDGYESEMYHLIQSKYSHRNEPDRSLGGLSS